MNDKYKLLLEQYDIQIDYLKRGRGELLCNGKQGLYALAPTKLSQERMEIEYAWKQDLIQAGFHHTDYYIRNKKGEFISYDKYYEPYVMRKTFPGSECNIHSLSDLNLAAKNLAVFHRISKNIPKENYQVSKKISILKSYEKRSLELKNIYKYIHNKKNKGPFEYLFLEEIVPIMKEQATAISYMKHLASFNTGWCHGAYNQHNVILGRQGVFTFHFEHFYYGYSMMDLYYFIRKVLEKNNYDFDYCQHILFAYTAETPLSLTDYALLYTLFLYPEKFWKISNQYMNHKKHWVSPRYLHKLSDVIATKEVRNLFLAKYFHFYKLDQLLCEKIC